MEGGRETREAGRRAGGASKPLILFRRPQGVLGALHTRGGSLVFFLMAMRITLEVGALSEGGTELLAFSVGLSLPLPFSLPLSSPSFPFLPLSLPPLLSNFSFLISDHLVSERK